MLCCLNLLFTSVVANADLYGLFFVSFFFCEEPSFSAAAASLFSLFSSVVAASTRAVSFCTRADRLSFFDTFLVLVSAACLGLAVAFFAVVPLAIVSHFFCCFFARCGL